MRRRRPAQTLLKKLHRQAWQLFSEYVRKKSKGICFTCGVKKDWKEMDAGHYIHGRLDYDERNVNSQCVRCNRYLHGNLGRYSEQLFCLLGKRGLLQLRFEANQVKKYEPWELEKIIETYKQKIKQLENLQ